MGNFFFFSFLAVLSLRICLGGKLLNMIPLSVFGNNLSCTLKGLLVVYLNYQSHLPKKENEYVLVSAFAHMEVSGVIKNFPLSFLTQLK